MSSHYNTATSKKDNLFYLYDPANPKSYSQVGSWFGDLSLTGNPIEGATGVAPTFTKTNMGEFTFNGIDQYLFSQDNIVINGITDNNVHTIEAWIKPANTPTTRQWPYLYGQDASGSHHWLWDSSENLNVGAYGGSQIAIPLNVGEWAHITVVWSGTLLYAYKNGKLHSKASGGAFNITTQEINIAKSGGAGTEAYFAGSFGIMRGYRVALNAAEVFGNYCSDKGRYLI